MQEIILRYLDIEPETNTHKVFLNDTLPNNLLEIKKKIDQKCAFMMKTAKMDVSSKINQLKKELNVGISDLKSEVRVLTETKGKKS